MHRFPPIPHVIALLALAGCLKVVSEGDAGDAGGMTCDDNHPCPAGQYCDFEVQACDTNPGSYSGLSAPVAPGTCRSDCGSNCGPCQSDSDCAPFAACFQGTCQPRACPAIALRCPGACPATGIPHGCPVCLCPSCAGGPNCPDSPCTVGLSCCGGANCSDTQSDTMNCGTCGNLCLPGHFCLSGTCTAAECIGVSGCSAAGQACCGAQCCQAGEACCMVNAGASTLMCKNLDSGACPPGCVGCY